MSLDAQGLVAVTAYETLDEAENAIEHLRLLNVPAQPRWIESPVNEMGERERVGVAILVSREYYQEACELLVVSTEGAAGAAGSKGLACPECGGTKLKYGQQKKISILLRLFTLLTLATTIPQRTTCLECGTEFDPPEDW